MLLLNNSDFTKLPIDRFFILLACKWKPYNKTVVILPKVVVYYKWFSS